MNGCAMGWAAGEMGEGGGCTGAGTWRLSGEGVSMPESILAREISPWEGRGKAWRAAVV